MSDSLNMTGRIQELTSASSNTPVLSIEIAPDITVSLDCPLSVLVTVRREEDDINKPCIFRWDVDCDAWGPSGFMLFRHTSEGLEKIEVDHRPPPPETLEYTEWDAYFDELLPGQCLERNLGDLFPFYHQLVPGEKYKLLWPGAEYALWDWGTLREHIGHKVGVYMGLPRAIIPGGVCSSLTVIQEAEVFKRDPPPSPVRKSARIPGTPCLSVSLECPSEMIWGERITVTVKVTYDGLTNKDGETALVEAKPIIIRNLPFSFLNYQLLRRCHDYDQWDSDNDDPEWELYLDDNWNLSYNIVDGPDLEVNVTDEKLFLSLQPGESWMDKFTFDLSDLHEDTAVGDSYRFLYWGGCVEWWIWGTREEHADTTRNTSTLWVLSRTGSIISGRPELFNINRFTSEFSSLVSD
ncbi:hypothetical protein N7465_002782 [Penicillium sp. CMV-2018d]|nr:hypothetical protein N7465_002782 [Penicillium sp. CMV-2018d]